MTAVTQYPCCHRHTCAVGMFLHRVSFPTLLQRLGRGGAASQGAGACSGGAGRWNAGPWVGWAGGGGRDQRSLLSAKDQALCKGILVRTTQEEPHARNPAALLPPHNLGWVQGGREGRKLYVRSFRHDVGYSLPKRPVEDTEHRGRVAWWTPGEVVHPRGRKGETCLPMWDANGH